jgi:hypothetical protein
MYENAIETGCSGRREPYQCGYLSISILRFGRWKKGKIEIGLSSCTREMTGTGFASATHCFVDIAEGCSSDRRNKSHKGTVLLNV